MNSLLIGIPFIVTVTCYVCLECSPNLVIFTELFYKTYVIQMGGLASYQTKFEPQFIFPEYACTQSGIWQLFFSSSVVDILPRSSVFVLYLFSTINIGNTKSYKEKFYLMQKMVYVQYTLQVYQS